MARVVASMASKHEASMASKHGKHAKPGKHSKHGCQAWLSCRPPPLQAPSDERLAYGWGGQPVDMLRDDSIDDMEGLARAYQRLLRSTPSDESVALVEQALEELMEEVGLYAGEEELWSLPATAEV